MFSRLILILAFALTAVFQPASAFAMDTNCAQPMRAAMQGAAVPMGQTCFEMNDCGQTCAPAHKSDSCRKICSTPCVAMPGLVVNSRAPLITSASAAVLSNYQDTLIRRSPNGLERPPKV